MKVGGQYDSVVGGVSEQVPQDRRPGQMFEQINMISDPVHGLVRRRGSEWQAEQSIGAGTLATFGAEAGLMQEFTFVISGVEYSLLYRKQASEHTHDTFAYLYCKTTAEWLPIVYENSTWVDDLVSGGVSAITSIGEYVYIAGNTNVPAYTQVDNWSTTANQEKIAVWIRAGAYARTFSVTLTKTDGTTVEYHYLTKASSYPELLDTSGISFYEMDGTTPRPDYQKDINDATNLYNSNVTAHIGVAAQDITGENIAQKLVDLMQADGISASRQATTIIIDDADFVDVAVDDGGDNTLMRGVGREVTSPTLMSVIHYVGKVVRVRPEGQTDDKSYYLVAYAEDGVSTGWANVVWREGPGVTTTPTNIFSQAVITAGTMYIAQDGAGLTALDGQDHPAYKASVVGDSVSTPIPAFFGNPITMMSIFQDRLIIGTGGTVNCSRNGDYLNFFRQTVISILDDDPVEMYSYGSEGDTLRYAVTYDRDMVLFGDLKQYGINGKTVLSAQSPLITTVCSFANATQTSPVSSGNFVFYSKNSEGRTSMHQLQIGQLTDVPVSSENSQQLDKYLVGVPTQLAALTAPNLVFMRSGGQKSSFYLYMYLDDPSGGSRLLDSWSKWQYADVLGQVIGLSTYKGDVLIYTMRPGGANLYIVADKVNLSNELSNAPYMDSMRPYTNPLTGWHLAATAAAMSVAADNTSSYFLLGTTLPKVADLITQLPGVTSALRVGAVCDAYVNPTNPYFKNYRTGKSQLAGRLVLSQIIPTVDNTGGLIGMVSTVNGQNQTITFEGRLLGRNSNIIAQQPLVTATLAPMGVGKEIRDCTFAFKSVTWLPLNITTLEWTGHYFNRVRQV